MSSKKVRLIKLGFSESKGKPDLWIKKRKDGTQVMCDFRTNSRGVLYTYVNGVAQRDTPEIRKLAKKLRIKIGKKRFSKLPEEASYPEDIKKEGERILLEGKLLNEVRKWGYKQYRELGRFVYTEFAKAVLLKKAPVLYDPINDKKIRGLQHCLMLWEQSWFKSSSANSFFGLAHDKRNGVLNSAWSLSDPHVLSPERLRGDFVRTKKGLSVQLPYPATCDFIVIDELSSFLGTSDIRLKMLALLNSLIEQGEGSVSLIKMGKISKNEFREFVNKDVPKKYRNNFYYNEKENRIIYKTKTVFIAATNLSEQKNFKDLQRSGFLNRFKIIIWNATWDEKFKFLQSLNYPAKIKTCSKKAIRYAWHIIQRSTFKEITSPPADYIEEILIEYRKELDKVNDDNIKKKLVHGRLRGNIMRELVAHAISKQWVRAGRITTEFDKIRYTKQDLKYVTRMIPDMIIQAVELERIIDSYPISPTQEVPNILLSILTYKKPMKAEVFYRRAMALTDLSKRAIQKQLVKLIKGYKIKRYQKKGKWYFKRIVRVKGDA